MADSQETTEGVQQLQSEIEKIFLEYQKVVSAEEAMAPKETTKKKVDGGDGTEPDEDDLEGARLGLRLFERFLYLLLSFAEIETVSENIDVLNSALDSIEAQTDRIRNQLLQLLAANREVRQYIRDENEKLQHPDEDEAKGVNERENGESASE